MPKTIHRLLLLCLSCGVSLSVLAGCAAKSTYVQAIGTWSTEPVLCKTQASVEDSRSVTGAIWDSWQNRIQRTLQPAIQLTVYRDASYLLEVAGVKYEGQAHLTSLFGEGLAVKTAIGSVEAEGRIRIVEGQKMVIESDFHELGTELTLHRMP